MRRLGMYLCAVASVLSLLGCLLAPVEFAFMEGFNRAYRFGPPSRMTYAVQAAILGLVAAVFAISALQLWRAEHRRSHTHAGLCPACGYDVRATPGRCPECGTPAAAAASGSSAG